MIKKFLFNKALRILLVTNSLILISVAMLGPIYALFVKEVGGSLLDASITGAAFAVSAGITTLISGNISDKIKENKIIVSIGYFLIGTGFLLFTQVNSMITLLLVQLLLGFGEAIYAPAYDSEYCRHLDEGKSGTQWGAWEAMSYFASGLGAIAGGFIATRFGFDVLFVIMAILCFASSVYIYLLPKKVL